MVNPKIDYPPKPPFSRVGFQSSPNCRFYGIGFPTLYICFPHRITIKFVQKKSPIDVLKVSKALGFIQLCCPLPLTTTRHCATDCFHGGASDLVMEWSSPKDWTIIMGMGVVAPDVWTNPYEGFLEEGRPILALKPMILGSPTVRNPPISYQIGQSLSFSLFLYIYIYSIYIYSIYIYTVYISIYR